MHNIPKNWQTRRGIYGARFVGDKAYVVTFRRTDPLYVIDVKTPLILKLSVNYRCQVLPPIYTRGENYLFSLGQNADETGRVTGIKTELIDVSNPAKPTSVRSMVLTSTRQMLMRCTIW